MTFSPSIELTLDGRRVYVYDIQVENKAIMVACYHPDDELSNRGSAKLPDPFLDVSALPTQFKEEMLFQMGQTWKPLFQVGFLCFHVAGLLIYGSNKRMRRDLSRAFSNRLPSTQLLCPENSITEAGIDLSCLDLAVATRLRIGKDTLMHTAPLEAYHQPTMRVQSQAEEPGTGPDIEDEYGLPELLHAFHQPPPGSSVQEWLINLLVAALVAMEADVRNFERTISELDVVNGTADTSNTLRSMQEILGMIKADFPQRMDIEEEEAGQGQDMEEEPDAVDLEAGDDLPTD